MRTVISRLQQGHRVPEAEQLSDAERQQLLHELQAIMAVYDRRN